MYLYVVNSYVVSYLYVVYLYVLYYLYIVLIRCTTYTLYTCICYSEVNTTYVVHLYVIYSDVICYMFLILYTYTLPTHMLSTNRMLYIICFTLLICCVPHICCMLLLCCTLPRCYILYFRYCLYVICCLYVMCHFRTRVHHPHPRLISDLSSDPSYWSWPDVLLQPEFTAADLRPERREIKPSVGPDAAVEVLLLLHRRFLLIWKDLCKDGEGPSEGS